MTESEDILRVSRISERCRVLGPGVRGVVWFHGCPRHCLGCIAEEMNASDEETVFSPQALAMRLASVPETEGLTLSGGEPFAQNLTALAAFIRMYRAKTSLGVICYTGYLREALEHLPGADEVVSLLDVLIDGPYRLEDDDNRGLRGSSNQRIHRLTSLYDGFDFENGNRRVQADLNLEGELSLSGVPNKGFMGRFRRELEARMIRMK